MKELIRVAEKMLVGALLNSRLADHIPLGRARIDVQHCRPKRFVTRPDGLLVPDPESYYLLDEETIWNLVTNSGRDQLHLQGYGTTGLATNGFNYIALSNDSTAPSASDTSLTGEISANGLGRTQGAYAHTTGTNTTTISNTFTATGSQSCQKAALFNASSSGVMNHEATFTQRSLISGDTLAVTYTITLG